MPQVTAVLLEHLETLASLDHKDDEEMPEVLDLLVQPVFLGQSASQVGRIVVTFLWIGFCHTGPISLCVDLFAFICVYFVFFCFILHSRLKFFNQ